MAEKLHVGIIGSGGMTKNHSRGYLNSGQYEIVALADLSSEVMNEYDKVFSEYDDYKAQHFTDFREMLQEAKPDVVSIGVWLSGRQVDGLQTEQGETSHRSSAALPAGLHSGQTADRRWPAG